MRQYKNILIEILEKGYKCPPAQRQDVGTIQINSHEFKHDLREGFPLLTTKKLSLKNIATELLWFLRGDTNIKYLVDNGCNIWNSDAFKFYLRKHKEHGIVPEYDSMESFIQAVKDCEIDEDYYNEGDLGPIYSKQWRNIEQYHKIDVEDIYGVKQRPVFEKTTIDQISNLIRDIKEAVSTGNNNRRLKVEAWNPAELSQMGLPPCHTGFQVILEPISTSERLDILGYERLGLGKVADQLEQHNIPKYYLNLKWSQRSVDTFLGLPYNIASYALLAHLLALMTNTSPKELIGSLSAVHIYENHIEQCNEQLNRAERSLPHLVISSEVKEHLDYVLLGLRTLDDVLPKIKPTDFTVETYNPHPAIKAEIVT